MSISQLRCHWPPKNHQQVGNIAQKPAALLSPELQPEIYQNNFIFTNNLCQLANLKKKQQAFEAGDDLFNFPLYLMIPYFRLQILKKKKIKEITVGFCKELTQLVHTVLHYSGCKHSLCKPEQQQKESSTCGFKALGRVF